MALVVFLISFAGLAGHALARGSAFCQNHPGYNACLRRTPAATPFCQSYLQASTSTVVTTTTTLTAVSTQTITQGTTTVWSPIITTQSQPTGTSTVTLSGNGTFASTCSRTTLTPYTTVVPLPPALGGGSYTRTFTGPYVRVALPAATSTSSAAISASSAAISAPPAAPACLSGKPSATISSACSCLSLANPTVTRTTSTTTTDASFTFVTSGTDTFYYPSTTTRYGTTVTTTSTSYSATATTYDLKPNSTFKVNDRNYQIYNDYRFNFNPVGISFYSCQYGLCDLQPQPCAISDCPNGLTDCLQVCPFVKGCNAVLFESKDVNNNKTCAFIDTRKNPLSCGYVDDLDDFGVQKKFAFP